MLCILTYANMCANLSRIYFMFHSVQWVSSELFSGNKSDVFSLTLNRLSKCIQSRISKFVYVLSKILEKRSEELEFLVFVVILVMSHKY